MEKVCKDMLDLFSEKWALVSAGNQDGYNAMTIGWGTIGTLWSKPICSVFVKPIRYTYNYLENHDYFTVSFYDESYRDDLMYLGRTSGRDEDKVSKTKLVPEYINDTVTFKQAVCTIVCKKIYFQDLDQSVMSEDIISKYYISEEPHRMYVGEVIDIINCIKED